MAIALIHVVMAYIESVSALQEHFYIKGYGQPESALTMHRLTGREMNGTPHASGSRRTPASVGRLRPRTQSPGRCQTSIGF